MTLPAVALAVAACLVAVTVVAVMEGVARLAGVLVGAGSLGVGLLAVRVAPALTVADVSLYAAAVVLGLRLPATPRPFRTPLVAVALIATGGLAGSLVSDVTTANAALLLRFVLGSAMPLVAVAWWDPGTTALRRVVWLYGLGAVASTVVGLLGADNWGRAYGLSLHPNHLGLLCVLGTGAFLAVRTGRHRALATAGLVATLAGVVASGSRGALVSLVATYACFVWAQRDWRLGSRLVRAAVVLACLAVLGAVQLPETSALARLFGDESAVQSDVLRAERIDEGIQTVLSYPVTGRGFAADDDGLDTIQRSHSVYLAVWASAGLLGVAGMALLVRSAVRGVGRARGDALSAGLMSGYVGYLTMALFSVQLWDRYVWLALALGLQANRLRRRGRAHTGPGEAGPVGTVTRP